MVKMWEEYLKMTHFFGNHEAPSRNIVVNLINKFETTNTVLNK